MHVMGTFFWRLNAALLYFAAHAKPNRPLLPGGGGLLANCLAADVAGLRGGNIVWCNE